MDKFERIAIPAYLVSVVLTYTRGSLGDNFLDFRYITFVLMICLFESIVVYYVLRTKVFMYKMALSWLSFYVIYLLFHTLSWSGTGFVFTIAESSSLLIFGLFVASAIRNWENHTKLATFSLVMAFWVLLKLCNSIVMLYKLNLNHNYGLLVYLGIVISIGVAIIRKIGLDSEDARLTKALALISSIPLVNIFLNWIGKFYN
ncbi:hypothetical protein GC194_07860 [bacterium]|nr:hypothetical protein [bacterium]